MNFRFYHPITYFTSGMGWICKIVFLPLPVHTVHTVHANKKQQPIHTMKKIYSLLVSALLISGVSQAQSLSASNVYVSGPVFMMEGHATITNNSGTAKDVLVQRTINNIFSTAF